MSESAGDDPNHDAGRDALQPEHSSKGAGNRTHGSGTEHSVQVAPTIGQRPRKTSSWLRTSSFLGHNLVAVLVSLALGGAGSCYWSRIQDRTTLRNERLTASAAIEPWATDYLLTVGNTANLSVTYGQAENVRSALESLKNLRAQAATLSRTRGAQIANLFGGDALNAYIRMDAGVLRLETCLELTQFRMKTFEAEDPGSMGRDELRASCSNALREINDSTNALLQAIALGLAELNGGSRPFEGIKYEWVRADIQVNQSDGPVVLRNGESFKYSWSAPNATACDLTAPIVGSSVTVVGMGGPVGSDHPWYPPPNGASILGFACTNGWADGVDSVTIHRR